MKGGSAMRSWQSVLFEKFLILRGTKKKFLDAQLMTAFINSKKTEKPYELSPKYREKHNIKKSTLNDMDVYTIREQENPSKVIYYFHGGAYINDPLSFHWRYLVRLAEVTGYTIIVPIYPKLPHVTHEQTFQTIHALYDEMLKRYNVPMIFMGDSAGGGLALGFAQDVKLVGKKQPEHIVLHSPWLDISGEDPRYKEKESVDPMLGVLGAQMLGRMWANGVDLKHYRISPLYGELKGIGEITLFVGTGELLHVDAQMLLERAEAQGVSIRYFEYDKMNHVFPVFPIPEAKRAMAELIGII